MSEENKVLTKKITEESIRAEFEATYEHRVERYLEVKPHGIIPNTHFARASSECFRLYRDGHYYGCISLVQSVAEALTVFLAKKNGINSDHEYEKLIAILKSKQVITDEQATNFKIIWKKRNDYHHLNDDVSTELAELQSLAKEKIEKLKEIESEVFSFSIKQAGVITPDKPQYWRQTGSQVFLRLD